MAKPRVFVSSTYYDLRHIRDRLEHFIDSLGYEPVLFESGDIAFDHERPLDVSCYDEVDRCQILVLIIGGRYGSPASGEALPEGTELEKLYADYNSITKKEYERARRLDIPIYIFVESGVLSEFDTYRENREKTDTKYAHVDNVSVFRLLDDIMAQPRNNFVRGFARFDDISGWLKEQWAGLFANLLSKRTNERTLGDLNSQLSELRHVTGALKQYSETIMRQVTPDEAHKVIAEQQQKIAEGRRTFFLRQKEVLAFARVTEKDPGSILEATRDARSHDGFFKALGFTEREGVYRYLGKHGKVRFDADGAEFFHFQLRHYLGLYRPTE